MLYYSTHPNAAASMLAALCGLDQQNMHCRDYRWKLRMDRAKVGDDAVQQLINQWCKNV